MPRRKTSHFWRGLLLVCALSAGGRSAFSADGPSDVAADGPSFEPKVAYTAGSQHYKGVDTSAVLTVPLTLLDSPGDFHITPSYASSTSDVSTGTFATEGLELGVEGSWLGVIVSGSMSPKVDGYQNRALGGELTFQYPPNAAPAAEGVHAEKVDASDHWTFHGDAGFNVINHSDDFQVVTTTTTIRKKVRTRVTGHSLDVKETDWTLSAEAGRGLFDWTGQATFSGYDKNLNKLGVRPALIARLPGLSSTLQGFPDHHYNTRVSVQLPIFSPYVNYSYTTFELNQPSLNGYTGGGLVDVGPVELDASYERDVPTDHSARLSYAKISASYLF